jgi:hypothetical protein
MEDALLGITKWRKWGLSKTKDEISLVLSGFLLWRVILGIREMMCSYLFYAMQRTWSQGFQLEYRLMGHWRLAFSFPFVRALGYKYLLQVKDRME